MVDPIVKAFKKLSTKQQLVLTQIFIDIKNRTIDTYDVKQLKGHKNIFRIRKGEYRVIFFMDQEHIAILVLEKRNEKIYKSL
jgi:mRNA-degrading endonuclease RelE of RelBE toxin-antitoxin system